MSATQGKGAPRPPAGAGAPPPAAGDEHPAAPAEKNLHAVALNALRAASKYMPYWRPLTPYAREVKLDTLKKIRSAIADLEAVQ